MDTAGADHLGVDAVVYPGLLSDISLNDGGGGRASFGRRDTPGAANGIPTVVFPAGYNDHGQPINIQLLGRAWDDAKLVGMAYAFEELANAAGKGHVGADHRAGVDVQAGQLAASRRAGHLRQRSDLQAGVGRPQEVVRKQESSASAEATAGQRESGLGQDSALYSYRRTYSTAAPPGMTAAVTGNGRP